MERSSKVSVFVDGIVHHPDCGLRFDYWCHMRADTLEELHEMAEKLGMRPEWFQDKPGAPHYDLIPEARAMAIELGAIPLTRREWVAKFPLKPRPKREAEQAPTVDLFDERILLQLQEEIQDQNVQRISWIADDAQKVMDGSAVRPLKFDLDDLEGVLAELRRRGYDAEFVDGEFREKP